MHDKELSWEVPEYDEKTHSTDWYWAVGVATFIIIVGAIYWHDYLFAFLILIGVSTLVYLTVRQPEIIQVLITDRGVRVRTEFFTFKSIKAFWVEREPQENGDQHLLLMTSRTYSPIIAISLGDLSPDEVRKFLLPHLKEEEMHESVSHKFIEMFGF